MKELLFKYELADAWKQPISNIVIFDKIEDNVVINGFEFTLSIEYIEKVKRLLSNEKLYEDIEMLFPPVLDGTSHEILLSYTKTKKINCFNLWYWKDANSFENCREKNKDEIEYTKLIINLIDGIQKILDEKNIDFNIIDGE